MSCESERKQFGIHEFLVLDEQLVLHVYSHFLGSARNEEVRWKDKQSLTRTIRDSPDLRDDVIEYRISTSIIALL